MELRFIYESKLLSKNGVSIYVYLRGQLQLLYITYLFLVRDSECVRHDLETNGRDTDLETMNQPMLAGDANLCPK